jgi:protein subunit release factor A
MECCARDYLDLRISEQEAERRACAAQVGTGDRSAKIRNLQLPQSRVTDHRIGSRCTTSVASWTAIIAPLDRRAERRRREERSPVR